MAVATDDILAIQKLIADYNHIVISGRYEDTLRRDDGTWRFVSRKLIPDA